MKRKSLLFLLLFALLAPWAANAQQTTLTVYDEGTTTNNYVPIYGLYCDEGVKCEFIIPAEQLAEMTNGTISAMKFYLASVGYNTIEPSFTIFVKEVDFTTMTAYTGTTDATTVFNSTFTFTSGATNVEIEVPFSENYTYEGGNLLIGVYQNGTSGYSSLAWTGVSQDYNSAWRGYGSSTGSAQKFLPKTTFTYTAGASDCDMPAAIAVSNVTADGATVTWEGDGDKWNLRYKASTDADFTILENLTTASYTLSSLQGNTTYSVGVQTVCTSSTSFFKSTSFTTENPCAAPTALETTDITDASATLSWTAGYPTQSSWIVNYKKSADAWTDAQTETVTSPTVTLANLEENTTYNVRIYACADGAYLSGNFTTKYACAAPTNFVASNITVSSATLSWTAGYQETAWTVKYKKSSESSWDNATTVSVSGTPTTSLTGLDGLTTYNVRVFNCTGENDPYLSGNFTTAASFPYSQDFSGSTSIPTGWAQYSGLLADVMAGTATLSSGYGWSNGTSNGVLDGNHIYANIYSTGCTKWIVTPAIPVESGARLTFDVAYTAYSGTAANPQTTGTDDKFVVLASTDNMATWTILRQWDNAGSEYVLNELTPATLHQIFDLADYAGQNVIVAFYGESTVSNADNNIHVDNVVFELTPSCEKPTNLSVENDGLNATFTWSSDATSFDVAYSMDNTANPDDVIVATVNTTFHEFTNLALGDHYVWVRANCSATAQSEWAGPRNIHIGYCLPAPTSVDNQGISNVTFGIGDDIVNNTTTMGTGVATYLDYTSLTGALQAGVESTVAITYKTSYTYGTIIWVDFDNSLSFEESEIVYTGTSTNANPTTLNATVTIPATTTTGNYVMRIGGTDSAFDSYISGTSTTAPNPCYTGSYGCFQDYTLSVLEAPTCFTPTNLAVSNITGHTAELSWTAGGEETAWQICINRDETNLIDVTTNPYPLSELAPETEYIVMVRANCGEEDGVSAWSNEVVFTTDVACPAPTALTVSNVTPVGATISWEGSAESYTLRYKAASGFNYGFEQAEPWAVDNFPPCTTYDGDQTQTYAFDGATFTNIPYTGACIAFQSQTGNMSSHNGNAFGLMISAVPGEEAAVQNNDWFILPELTIAEGDIFSFWGREITDQYGDEIINVGVYGSTEGTFASLLAEELAISGTEWTLYSYDLSAYAGQTIRLAINYISTDVFGFMFDDIFVGNPNAAEWDEIITDATSPYVISGLTAETVYDVEVQANCGEEGNSEWVASSFTTLSLCNAISELTVTNVSGTGATLNWTGFMDSYNVRYRTAEDADILFFEDFSNGIGDWTTENLNASSGIYENSWFRFYWTTTPPQYLISPELEGVVSGTTLQFVYAAPSTNYTETFQVGVSSTDNSIDSFTWGEEISTVNNQGQYYVTELPEGTKYFAIKCTSDDQLYLYVTNFLVFANHVEAGEWVELNGVTSPLAIPGLTPDTWYEWQVQGVDCGEYWFDGEAFQTLATVTQTMELTAGWNWWSTYIDADNLLSQLEASLGTNGMAISTTGGGLTYRNGRWMGTINSISNSKGYKIRTNAPVTVEIEGLVINPEECPITINRGWNWIGYPVTEAQAVGTALAGFTPTNGDNIKTQGGGATYRNGRWMPANFTLEPGKSYAYKSNSTETTTLIFSNSAKSVSESKANGGKYVFKTMPVSPKNQIEGTKEVSLTKKFINSNN